MGLLDFLKKEDINDGVLEFQNTPKAVLLDVRTPEEFKQGYIPRSQNIPLQLIDNTKHVIEDKNTPIFVYCRSGNRSGQAKTLLEAMGYANVKNIGGIISYKGQIAK